MHNGQLPTIAITDGLRRSTLGCKVCHTLEVFHAPLGVNELIVLDSYHLPLLLHHLILLRGDLISTHIVHLYDLLLCH